MARARTTRCSLPPVSYGATRAVIAEERRSRNHHRPRRRPSPLVESDDRDHDKGRPSWRKLSTAARHSSAVECHQRLATADSFREKPKTDSCLPLQTGALDSEGFVEVAGDIAR